MSEPCAVYNPDGTLFAMCPGYAELLAERDQLRARVATLEQDADALVEGHVKVTVAGLTQQVEAMTAALKWYAEMLGNSKSMDYRVITQDGGKRARDALMKNSAHAD